ncbi:uroporphyrinogen decarboxylase family protein [Staphylococcus aureus]
MRESWPFATRISKIERKYSLFDITHQPELCAYVTHLPVDNYHTDAAILYKDIMTPLKPIGVDVEIKSGIGPVIHNPIKTIQDVEKLSQIDP